MGEVANIPQLRFPEFSNEWEESKVGKVFKVSAGGDIKTENVSQIKTDGFPYPIYANAEKAKGLYGYSNLYKSEANVVTVAGRGVNIGIAHVRLEPFYPIVRLLVLNPIKDADVKFWENQLNQLNLFVESTGVPQLTAPQISSYKVKYPSKPEQQKIAAFLTAVDNKIEQLSKKQELLGEYKKGLMQQIFSQAIRFKADDGSEFPEWKERRLGDVCSKAKSGGTPRSTTKEYYDGDIPFLAISDITRQGKYLTSASKKISQLGIDNSASWIVPIDTIIYSMYASVGFVSINKIPLATSQAVINLIVKDGYSIEFIYYHLIEVKKTIHKFIETGTQGNLNAQTVKSLILNIPSLPEQAKIANFLSSIDTKIEQVGKQLDESKQFKKALLQQMFV